MPDNVLYLIWTGLFAAVWFVLFYYYRHLRREMLVVSSVFGLGGIISQLVYIQDWWQPRTITNTAIGIEDFLIGFFIGGVAAVIYEAMFHKRLRRKKDAPYSLLALTGIIIAFLILFLGCFYFLEINSMLASLIAFTLFTIAMMARRPDLIINSLASGLLVLLLGVCFYGILNLLKPGFITEYWYLKDGWYTTLLFGIPVAEYVWYFLAGAFIGPFYEFWQETKLINNN